jgi:hypothetical protein
MRTITLELPDNTPVMSIIRFANDLGCDAKLAGLNHFRFKPREESRQLSTVVSLSAVRANSDQNPTPPSAA